MWALNCTPPGIQTQLHFQLPDTQQPARSLTDFLTALAGVVVRRQPHNVPPLHTAQAVHEVVVKEYRIVGSVNYELATHSPADLVCLFETRFSLTVEHLRQRFPQGTGSLLSLLARFPSALSMTARSPWSSRQVASEVLPGSFRAWSGSVIEKCQTSSFDVHPPSVHRSGLTHWWRSNFE